MSEATFTRGATLSLVVPCFNEQEALPLFYGEACKIAQEMTEKGQIGAAEFVFVDDGSSDATLAVMRDLAARDGRVRYVSFSRNFGKEAALYAGLSKATGDFVAVLDCDLQDPPPLISKMLAAVQSGDAECAATRRVNRAGGLRCARSLPARSTR